MTSDSTVVSLRQPDAVEDPLTAVLREGARRLLAQAVEAEAEVLYRKPNTSKPAPGHKIYPYLLRNLAVTGPNQVWAMDISVPQQAA